MLPQHRHRRPNHPNHPPAPVVVPEVADSKIWPSLTAPEIHHSYGSCLVAYPVEMAVPGGRLWCSLGVAGPSSGPSEPSPGSVATGTDEGVPGEDGVEGTRGHCLGGVPGCNAGVLGGVFGVAGAFGDSNVPVIREELDGAGEWGCCLGKSW